MTPRRLAPVVWAMAARATRAAVLAGCFLGAAPGQSAAAAPNVLLVLVDDLNAWLGCLGHTVARTANIDRLAARGVLFTNAHCAGPACNPSRAALLSGMRPTTTGVYTNDDDWKAHIKAGYGVSVPFQRAGYRVAGAGKIAHGSRHHGSEWHEFTAAEQDDEEAKLEGLLEPPAMPENDADLPDWQTVDDCIARIGRSHARPFFLACGLRRPHLPWSVPQKYFDLFPSDQVGLPPRAANDLDDVPPSGLRLAEPTGTHRKVLKRGRWREAVRAYLAACAYADMNVGRLLDALDASPHARNTIVVLAGDHGVHLGEKEHWGNETLWEPATRVPLIVVAPGVRPGRCHAAVELLAVFPTLCDLAGLPIPAHVEGKSLRPLLARPDAPVESVAVTTLGHGDHAVRTARWRYIRYADGGEELYDHDRDPNEWRNLASEPDLAATKVELARHIPAHAVSPGESRVGPKKNEAKDVDKKKDKKK